jgi:hypothetical protein
MSEITLFLRPQNQDGWRMHHHDCKLIIHDSIDIHTLRKKINELKPHISPYRIQFKLTTQKLIPDKLFDWSCRRHGLHDEYILTIEPTAFGGWLWNEEQYYIDKCLEDVRAIISSSHSTSSTLSHHEGAMPLDELESRIVLPFFMKYSLRALLRQYTDQFQIIANISTGLVQVALVTEIGAGPVWMTSDIELLAVP